MVGWHHQLNGHEFEQVRKLVMDRKDWGASVQRVGQNLVIEQQQQAYECISFGIIGN